MLHDPDWYRGVQRCGQYIKVRPRQARIGRAVDRFIHHAENLPRKTKGFAAIFDPADVENPALVSKSKIDPGFYQASKPGNEPCIPSILDQVGDGCIGVDGQLLDLPLQSMVLVGMKHKNGEYFLLKNWWETMQCVEVSAEYFISSMASLVLDPPQLGFPKDTPVLLEKFAETHFDGRWRHRASP